MLEYILLSLICIILIQAGKYLNLIDSVFLIVGTTFKIRKVIFSKKISDNWKELVLPVYASKIMQHSLKILLALLFIITIIYLVDGIFSGFIQFIASSIGIASSMIISTVYILVCKFVLK